MFKIYFAEVNDFQYSMPRVIFDFEFILITTQIYKLENNAFFEK